MECEKSALNYREQGVEWDEEFMTQTEISIGLTAGRWLEEYRQKSHRATKPHVSQPTVETMLQSRDGLLQGKIDKVVWTDEGVVIIDYKTGSFDNHETLTHYEQQLLFYAYLWHDCHGIWPVEGRLVNPIALREHRLKINPTAAADVAADVRKLARSLADTPPPFEGANVGEHCRWCPFRPWCEPFWQSRNTSITLDAMEGETSSSACLEGHVQEVEAQGSASKESTSYLFRLSVGLKTIEVVGSPQTHPHLTALRRGDHVRVLNNSPEVFLTLQT